MKTPRRKHFNSNKDSSDVYIRESGPLEIGELETPNERRSAPVAAVRYLAGSKCQTYSNEETYSSEFSDYTDARSVESEPERGERVRYKEEKPHERNTKSFKKNNDFNYKTSDRGHLKHLPNISNNFVREFKMRYAPSLASDFHYYYSSKSNQDTLYHNMDYIHSQFTSFNPNFINFNYGHFSYPQYPLINDRHSDYYPPSYLTKYTSNYVNRFQDYGFYRPDTMFQRNCDYYTRPEGYFNRPQENLYNRNHQSFVRHPDNYYRLPNNTNSSANYSTNANYSYSEYNPKHFSSYSDHRYYMEKYNYPTDTYKSVPNINCETSHTENYRYSDDKNFQERKSEVNFNDNCNNYSKVNDGEAMQVAIEKAVKNAFEDYLSRNKLSQGEETCLTDPVNPDFKFDKNDATLTNQLQHKLYPMDYLQRLTFNVFDEFPEFDNPTGKCVQNQYPDTPKCDSNDLLNDVNLLNDPTSAPLTNLGATGDTDEDNPEKKLNDSIGFDLKRLTQELQKLYDDLNLDNEKYKNLSEFNSEQFQLDKVKVEVGYDTNRQFDNFNYDNQIDTDKVPENSKNFESRQNFNLGLSVDMDSIQDRNFELNQGQNSGESLEPQVQEEGGLFDLNDRENDINIEKMTNRDDESELLAGSNYEMDGSLGFENQYNETNYYPNFSEFSHNDVKVHEFQGFERDFNVEQGYKECLEGYKGKYDNLNGNTLSTSDLMESVKPVAVREPDDNVSSENYDSEEVLVQDEKNPFGKGNPFKNEKGSEKCKNKPGNSLFYQSKPLKNNLNDKYEIGGLTNKEFMLSESEYFKQSLKESKKTIETLKNDKKLSEEDFCDIYNRKNLEVLKINSNKKVDNSNFMKSQCYNVDGVSHILKRVDQLEECLKRVESYLNNNDEERQKLQKNGDESSGELFKEQPSTKTTENGDGVSEEELMEGYRAASVIKKLLHVKSMNSIIPAFTAFIQNRMA